MSGSYPAHEGLQVAHDDAPEVYRDAPFVETAPEVVPGQDEKFSYAAGEHPAPAAVQKRWCGLRPRRALLVLAVVVLVVIGAVAGGAIGGTQAHRNRGSPSSSASTSTSRPQSTEPSESTASSQTSSSSTAFSSSTASSTSTTSPVPTAGVLRLNCPAINDTQYTATSGSTKNTFRIYCLRDFPSDSGDVSASLAYSLNECIDHCVEHNAAGGDPPCEALTFGANLTRYRNANCFLKTAIKGVTEYKIDQFQAGALLLG